MPPTLDPVSWLDTEALAIQMVKLGIGRLQHAASTPVWQAMPEEVRSSFNRPLPLHPTPLAEILEEVDRLIWPYSMGNIHPRFFGWYMGASSFTGALADFLAGIDGSNLGGGNFAAAAVDTQVVEWLRQVVDFPVGASGTLTSGGSMANMVGLTVARNEMAGIDIRSEGLAGLPTQMCFYASDQAHTCHQKGLELLGLGSRSLRKVPTTAAYEMDLSALIQLIDRDIADGRIAACVIGTIGTTNTGAVDDIQALRSICDERRMWLHVDGCIGGLTSLSSRHSELARGLQSADSAAVDLHKMLHAPFEVGCAFVKDKSAHRRAFALQGPYLTGGERGAASPDHLFNYGFELSRAFKALKIWITLREHGAIKFGEIIDQTIGCARYLGDIVQASRSLDLVAPVTMNIVCFRYRGPFSDESILSSVNKELMLRLQERGSFLVTDTTLKGQYSLRAAVTNYRTTTADLDALVQAVTEIGDGLSNDYEQPVDSR